MLNVYVMKKKNSLCDCVYAQIYFTILPLPLWLNTAFSNINLSMENFKALLFVYFCLIIKNTKIIIGHSFQFLFHPAPGIAMANK